MERCMKWKIFFLRRKENNRLEAEHFEYKQLVFFSSNLILCGSEKIDAATLKYDF